MTTGARVCGSLLVFVAALAGCSGDDSSGPDGEPGPLAVVEVLRQDEVMETPPADVHLVELGQPLDEGVLVDDDSGFTELSVGSITASPGAGSGQTSVFPVDVSEQPGVVTLPDDRRLVAVSRPSDDEEYETEVGAVVVDLDAGTVDEVFRESGEIMRGGSGMWDPDLLVLRSATNRCFTWSAETEGSGFTEGDCPPLDPPPTSLTIEGWEVTCCDPLSIRDVESDEVVYERTAPAPVSDNFRQLPYFLAADEDTLVFQDAITDGDAVGTRLFVVHGPGEARQIGEWTWTDGLDAVEITPEIAGDVLIYHERVIERPAAAERLVRVDLETGESEVLLDGDPMVWGVTTGDDPWVLVSQTHGNPYPEINEEPDVITTTLYRGDAQSGELDEFADWEKRQVEGDHAGIYDPDGDALYITSRATGAGHGGREAIRIWRLGRTGEPEEVARGRELDIAAVGIPGGGDLVQGAPPNCDPRSHTNPCYIEHHFRVIDGELTDLGEIWAHLLPDQETLASTRTLGSGGAPYASRIETLDLADPQAGPTVVYESDEAMRLRWVDGAPWMQPSTDERVFCNLGCHQSDFIPQVTTLGRCLDQPESPEC